jgi:hypothetical protein
MQHSCNNAVRAAALQADSADPTDLVVFGRTRGQPHGLGSMPTARSFTRFPDPTLCHPFPIGTLHSLHSVALSTPSDSALFTTLHQSPPWLSHPSSIVRHTLFSAFNASISLDCLAKLCLSSSFPDVNDRSTERRKSTIGISAPTCGSHVVTSTSRARCMPADR